MSTAGGLLAIVLWSTTFALARSLSEQVGGITAASAVYLSGGCFSLIRLLTQRNFQLRVRSLSRAYLLGCGFLFVLYTILIYVAVGLARDREQLLQVALINYLWPAATIALSLPLLHLRASAMLLPGTVLALTGVFCVMTQGADISLTSFIERFRSNPLAYLFPFIAAIAWALYSNLTRRWTRADDIGAVELFVPATGLILLFIRFAWPESTVWTTRATGEAIVLGAITALAYALWDNAMRRGDLLLVASSSYFTPLLSTAVSCIYLKVLPGPKVWIGALLIVAGSLISWGSVRTAQPKS